MYKTVRCFNGIARLKRIFEENNKSHAAFLKRRMAKVKIKYQT